MHCMVLRLFLIYIFLYSACYAEKSVKEVQAYNMIEKAKAENVIQAGLINAIYFLNTEYFVLEGENRKIRNPLYSPEQARDYVNLLIRTLNLSRVDVLAKMIDEIHMVEICVSKLVKKYKELWTPSKDFYDRLKLISKDFTKRYNNIVAMAEEDKTCDGFIYKKCGFYEPGNTSLQRSLYYQGFNPEFCKSMIYENKYGGMDQPPLNMTPSDEDLKTDVVPRDARKAYQYAILNSTLFDTSNYANLCLNGIGTEKRPDIAALVFSRSVFWNWSAEDIVKQKKEAAFRWDTREYFMPLYAYMLYNGIEIKKDKAESVYISLGSKHGVAEGAYFAVCIERQVAGRTSQKEIGQLKAKGVEGEDLTLCEVKKGGKEIKAAMDNGQKLVIKSIQKPKSLFDQAGDALNSL